MRRRILIVEDEPEVLGVCRTLCDPTRYEVSFARTHDEALARLESPPGPDLVILEADMPDGGGVGFCRELKGRWPALRVVLLVRSERDRAGADWAGADGVLAKPVAPEALEGLLRQLVTPIDRWGAA